MDTIEDTLRLASVPELGPRTYLRLKEAFGTAQEILGASADSLARTNGVKRPVAEAVAKAAGFDPRPELESAANGGARILNQDDPNYPAALKSTFDPPILLYIKGDLRPADSIAISIVGTRQPSHYGRTQSERFASLLARTGFTIVSGLARGIDSAAHRGALDAEGRTLAVLGSGLSHIYPQENRDLAAEITGNGALVSEFPMDTSPARENFPRRNRIIAGLGLGTLVIEAPRRSGSLITARLANEQGREIFAIPGRIDQRNAEGCNDLIAAGQAKLVQSLDSILEELGPVADALKPIKEEQQSLPGLSGSAPAAPNAVPAAQPENERETRILAVIGEEQTHIDDICARSGLPAAAVSAGLMMLELKRQVKQLPGKFFVLS